MLKNILFFGVLIISFFFFQACDNKTVYKDYKKIPDKIWDRNFQPEFNVDIEDAETNYDIYIHIRNASMYPYSNIWVFMHSNTPTGETAIDTVECTLADEAGNWLGDGMGDIWDREILWKQNHHFPQKGEYTYRMEHAMRVKMLPGIMDVGISVERVEQE
jgi:gliding motility-associated lipoprotein GldH